MLALLITLHFVTADIIDERCHGVSHTACSQGKTAWILGRGFYGTYTTNLKLRESPLGETLNRCQARSCIRDGTLYWTDELSIGEALLPLWTSEFMPNVARDVGHEIRHFVDGDFHR